MVSKILMVCKVAMVLNIFEFAVDACMYDVFEAYCAYAILSVIPIMLTVPTTSKVFMKLLVFWSLKSPWWL